MRKLCFAGFREQSPGLLGYLPNGFPIFRIYGAEGDGEGDGGNSGGDGAGNDGDGSSSADTDTDKDGDGTGKDGDTDDERAALKRKLAAADRRAAAAEKKIQDAENQKLDEKTRAEKERDEANKAVETAAAKLRQQSIQIEFLENNKHVWHNPKAALKLVELDDVEVDDDGKVTGLDAAITKLAKEHPYLVKPADGKEGDGEGDGGKGKNGSSGRTPKSKDGKGASSGSDEQRTKLEAKYPVLKTGGRFRIPG